jgi:copper homeostasis protein (lipoprotein)
MKIKFSFLLLVLVFFTACNQNNSKQSNQLNDSITAFKDEHNAKNALDYVGIYKGILPCADCSGIETVLMINENDTYNLTRKYIGKGHKLFELKGTYSWNNQGNTITLSNVNDAPNQYFVGENTLTQLDMNGHKITSSLKDEYVLAKQLNDSLSIDNAVNTDELQEKVNLNDRIESKTTVKTGNPAVGKFTLAETKWKLVELYGKPVKQIGNKDYFIKLNSKDGRFSAYAGCNNMNGSYIMKRSFAISFTQVVSTMMACSNMDTEAQFAKMLERVDNYTIKDNKLNLNKAKMASLARFEAIE